MKVLTFGEIMDGGSTVFSSVASIDGEQLVVTFQGVVRIDNPYRYLSPYLDALSAELPQLPIGRTSIDFTELRFCNSNGLYIIMDIVETIYRNSRGPVLVRRLKEDDWQQETLPILLNIDEEEISSRTAFEDVQEI
jgi:hypothetical protein